MSPPQTDLNSKTMETPNIIIQGNDPRQAKPQSTRKVKIIAAVVLLSILIIGGITFGAIAYSYRLFYKTEYKAESYVDGKKVPEHIHVDYKNELIYVNNKQTGRIDGVKALYNYNRKLVAFYDETHNMCLIDRVDESFDEGLNFWSKYMGADSSKKRINVGYSRQPINREVLLRFGGEEIDHHCSNTNVTSHWVLRQHPKSQKDQNELDNDVDDKDNPTTDDTLLPEDVNKRVKRRDDVYIIITKDVIIIIRVPT